MRAGGGGDGQYSPGNYGFLDNPTLGNGANALRDAIAMESPSACFRQIGVDTQPGFIASVRDAVNVRFDIYRGPMSSAKNDPNMRPAMNVRKGYQQATGNACSGAAVTPPANPALADVLGLPRDRCFPSACPHMGGRMGDGDWNFEAYWTVNHTLPGGSNGEQPKPTVNGALASNTNLPSRWDVYLYEIAQGAAFINNPSGQALSPPPTRPETGAPICQNTASTNPDRRTFFAAIVNCEANLPPRLPLGPGNQRGVPVAAFGKFFLTQPVSDPQDEIMAELVGLVDANSAAGHNFDQVQLYR
jgi:hypothetical protein